MLRWSGLFFLIAIISAVFGFTDIVGAAFGFARISFFVFISGYLITMLIGLKHFRQR